MPTPANGLLQKIIVGLTLAAILAGGGALVTQAQMEAKVKHNTEAIVKATDHQIRIREDVAAVKVKVEAVEKAVEKNGDKLDRILEKVSSK